jgi:hypothetical protein
MAKKKERVYDRIKNIKRISREDDRLHGKPGVHADRKDKRIKRLSTNDYLDEWEDEEELENVFTENGYNE